MVRYIKDGAYTIVIDDVGAESKDEEQAGDDLLSTSGTGIPSRGTTESRHKIRSKRQIEEELDKIDFTSPDFILQNLKLAQPKYTDDSTCTLEGRKEIATIITHQIVFYVYCLLQSHIHNPTPPTILLFGDGYIGCKVIELLSEHGCSPLLRIYSRGEFSTNEWKKKGYLASSNLPDLMGNEKADIVIICSEYSSFQLVYHMLRDFQLIADTTGVITSTLGFQRKRLYYNFGVPTIFRTYVEPQKTVGLLKLKASESHIPKKTDGEKETTDGAPTTKATDPVLPTSNDNSSKMPSKSSIPPLLDQMNTLKTIDTIKEEPTEEVVSGRKKSEVEIILSQHGSSQVSLQTSGSNTKREADEQLTRSFTDEDEDGDERMGNSNEEEEEEDDDNTVENGEDESSIDNSSMDNVSVSKIKEEKLNPSEHAAFLIFQRTPDIKNILYLLENYYAINELSHPDARYLALRAIFGYIDPKRKEIPRRQTLITNEKQTPRKRVMVQVNFVEKIILSMYTTHVRYFQRFFSRLLTMNDFLKLTDTSTLVPAMMNDKTIGESTANSSAINSRINSSRIGSPPLEMLAASKQPKPHDTYIDASGRHHLLEDEPISKLKYLRMHDYTKINEIFQCDDDYSKRIGPGFEFMKILDNREHKKVSLNTLIQKPGVNYLFNAIDLNRKGLKTDSFEIAPNLLATGDDPSVMPDSIGGNEYDPFALPNEPTIADVGTMNISMVRDEPLNMHLKILGNDAHSTGASLTPSVDENESHGSEHHHPQSRKERYLEKLKNRSTSLANRDSFEKPTA